MMKIAALPIVQTNELTQDEYQIYAMYRALPEEEKVVSLEVGDLWGELTLEEKKIYRDMMNRTVARRRVTPPPSGLRLVSGKLLS